MSRPDVRMRNAARKVAPRSFCARTLKMSTGYGKQASTFRETASG